MCDTQGAVAIDPPVVGKRVACRVAHDMHASREVDHRIRALEEVRPIGGPKVGDWLFARKAAARADDGNDLVPIFGQARDHALPDKTSRTDHRDLHRRLPASLDHARR
jgi:hypothetical protein